LSRGSHTPNKYIALLLLAALLLALSAGCSTAGRAPAPSTSVEAVVPIAPGGAEQQPAPSTPTPEPENSEPIPSPEPEVTEPLPSPEPDTPEPEQSPPAADPPSESAPPVDSPAPEEPETDPFGIAAPRVGLYDLATLTAIYEKESSQAMAPASMSKIVTAVTALRYISPDTVFTVGTELQLLQPGASISFIAPGHRLTLSQLLMGMLLPSGCDAAYTIAVNVARQVAQDPQMDDTAAVEYFCGLMNDLAAELGAGNSHFANPDGWDHEDHYSTVYDMAIFAAHAMEYEVLREIVSTPEQWVMFVSGENITWRNTNALLHQDSGYYLPGAVGMKTGTTTAAGNCLLSVVEKDGAFYVAVVAGSPTKTGRYEDTLKLLELIPQ